MPSSCLHIFRYEPGPNRQPWRECCPILLPVPRRPSAGMACFGGFGGCVMAWCVPGLRAAAGGNSCRCRRCRRCRISRARPLLVAAVLPGARGCRGHTFAGLQPLHHVWPPARSARSFHPVQYGQAHQVRHGGPLAVDLAPGLVAVLFDALVALFACHLYHHDVL